MGPLELRNATFTGPLYRMGAWLVSPQIAVTGFGIARAALNDLIELSASKTPSYT